LGNCGFVVESDVHTKIQKLDVRNRLFANHVTKAYEAHDWGMLSFLQQVQGLARLNIEAIETDRVKIESGW